MSLRSQSGMSIVELMVGMLIALFLIGGLIQVFLGNREAFRTQQNLQRLQENARAAANNLAAVVANAGFHADPRDEADVIFPASNRAIEGTGDGSGSADSITVRYQNDGSLRDCLGNADGSPGAPVMVTNQYSVDASGSLLCQATNGAVTQTQPLLDGVDAMVVRYGVDSDGNDSVDQYLFASQVAAGDWDRVKTVAVSLVLRSEENVLPEAISTTYDLLGTSLTFNDRNARRVVTRVIAINSRLH